VVHPIRNVIKFVAYKDRKRLCADMRPIYAAPAIEAAEAALERFDQIWSKRYPASVAAWRIHGPYLTTFFRYPAELRRIVCCESRRDCSMQVKEVGSGAVQREQRRQLINAARRREIDVVLMWRLDRRARSLLIWSPRCKYSLTSSLALCQ
jgi:hypothetical protein